MMVVALLTIAAGLSQDPPVSVDVLAKYDLRPNLEITAVAGKVSFAKDEIVELVGATDLAELDAKPWNYRGGPLPAADQAAFWKILNLREKTREDIQDDVDKRTFALAFRIPKKPILCKDIAEDEGKNYELFLTRTVPASSVMSYIGLARVLKPKTDTGLFDYRLESPGGAWKDVTKFAFHFDTTIDGIEFDMRQYLVSEFVEVDGEQTTVEFTKYYFTLKLPEGLRELDLQVVSNDTAEELKALPVKNVIEHFQVGEDNKRFGGLDLFIVCAPKKNEFDRVFTLQARPKRIAVFKDIPVKAGS